MRYLSQSEKYKKLAGKLRFLILKKICLALVGVTIANQASGSLLTQ